MTLHREMGDEDFSLLEYLYNHLKCEGLATKRDIHRIIRAGRGTKESGPSPH